MAKVLNYETQIGQGLVIESWHVSQSVDAFTGVDAYDITLSGSSTITGSTNILASERSNLTLEINESASFEFLDGAPTTGSYILQTSPDTGKGGIKTYIGQGTATINTLDVPNQIFGVSYNTGSGTSEGEITFAIGKRDLTNTGGGNINSFYAAYEPGAILTNNRGEVEFHLGEHQRFTYGVLSEYRGGNDPTTQTSSYAGYFSASAFPNQQEFTRPFAISTISDVEDRTPALVVNKNANDLTSANFSVDYGGNVTASGHINVGNIFANDIDATGEYYIQGNHTLVFSGGNRLMFGTALAYDILQIGNALNPPNSVELHGPVTAFSSISASGALYGKILYIDNKATIDTYTSTIDELTLNPDGTWDAVRLNRDGAGKPIILEGNVTGSGHGLFQAGKPITTHTVNLTASLAEAGHYHIVGGNLTCSVQELPTTPVGAEFEFFQTSSAGNFLFEANDVSISIISKNSSLRLAQLGSSAVLKKIDDTTFHLMGDLT